MLHLSPERFKGSRYHAGTMRSRQVQVKCSPGTVITQSRGCWRRCLLFGHGWKQLCGMSAWRWEPSIEDARKLKQNKEIKKYQKRYEDIIGKRSKENGNALKKNPYVTLLDNDEDMECEKIIQKYKTYKLDNEN